jgi:cell division protein FtsB
MAPKGAAGSGPGAKKRPAASRTKRSRSAAPTRRAPRKEVEQAGRQTTLTARAAILVLAVASVVVAVALPLKIWLGQRGDIASLNAQTRQTQVKLGKLNAQNKQWQNRGYIEQQARTRLHYVLPGQKTFVVLGRSKHAARVAAARHHVAAVSGPWYSQFWQSDQAAGAVPHTK